MAHVAGLRVYPVKALDGHDREAVELSPGGTLAGDREFALFGPDGEPINGKRTDRVHTLETAYDPESEVLTVVPRSGATEPAAFDLEREVDAAEAWFEAWFEVPVELRRNRETGFVDRPDAGPSVVSTATLETVAGWFDALTVDDVRRRLRTNVEVGGVEAFWEDRFVGDDAPAFAVQPADGGPSVRVEGVKPCGRCVVPSRDPDTGEPLADFRERFIERRAATFPSFADRSAFPHDYTLMLIASVPEADREGTLSVGDDVTVVDNGS